MPSSSPYSEDAVGLQIARAATGDEQAFRSLVETHYGYARAIARTLLPLPEDVDDAVQESFIRVWKHLAEYDGRAKFTTWLHTIVTRLCYDRIRASTRRTFFFRRFEPDEDPADDSALTESRRAESSDLAERIVQLAHRLPPQQRTVFVLRDVQDRSIEEIAEELSMTANAVRVNLCYARKRIRQMMKTEGE